MSRPTPRTHKSSQPRGLITLAAYTALLGCTSTPPKPASSIRPTPTAAQVASTDLYTHQVQPIFQANCYRCHGGMNHRGSLQLDTRAGLLRGGHDGPVIVPGHPEQSLLIKLIRHEGPANDPMPMPPKRKIADTDISTITAWIQAGALTPPDTDPDQR